MYSNKINFEKPFDQMTEDEVIVEGMRAVRDYLESIRATREFKLEECVKKELWRVEMLYRRARGIKSYATMDAHQNKEWESVRRHYLPSFTELTLAIQRNYVRDNKISRLNASMVQAVIPAAFAREGLKATVTGQVHRALVEVTLPTSTVRFYVRFKDLEKEEMVEDVVKAVLDLRDAVTRLGFGAVVKTRKDRDGKDS